MGTGKFNGEGNPGMDWHSIQGESRNTPGRFMLQNRAAWLVHACSYADYISVLRMRYDYWSVWYKLKASLHKLVFTGIQLTKCLMPLEHPFGNGFLSQPGESANSKLGENTILRVAINFGVTTFESRNSSLGNSFWVCPRGVKGTPALSFNGCYHCKLANIWRWFLTLWFDLLWPSYRWADVQKSPRLCSFLDLPTFLHLTVAGRKAITAKKPSNEPAPGPTENT